MTYFIIHSIQDSPALAQPILTDIQQKLGFVPNLMARLAQSPVTLQTYLALGSAVEKTTLTPIEQQVVLLATSVENQCGYCVAAHSTIAKHKIKADATLVEAIRQQQPIMDKKLNALAQFTRLVVRLRGKVSREMLDDFLSAGYSQEQALEVLLGVTMKTLSNYANHVMGTTTVDAQFRAQAWEASAQA